MQSAQVHALVSEARERGGSEHKAAAVRAREESLVCDTADELATLKGQMAKAMAIADCLKREKAELELSHAAGLADIDRRHKQKIETLRKQIDDITKTGSDQELKLHDQHRDVIINRDAKLLIAKE